MKRNTIIVPKGVRYINDWKEYSLDNYNFPHILNKVLTGCGFTEYCIRCSKPVILVSPRKFLLENKADQHKKELEVYYVKNDIESPVNYEIDLINDKKGLKEEIIDYSDKTIIEKLENLKNGIKDYYMKCLFKKISCKILVTYDSFKYVKEALSDINAFSFFHVVVDEFQSVFIDAKFKSDTEINLLYQLNDIQSLCFVSATPMLDKYLERLDEFKNLPYYELDWVSEDPNRIKKPKFDVRFTYGSLINMANRVVQSYLSERFETRLDPETGGLIESKEAVLFMNSVKNICQVIRSNSLHIDQCNVLCAKTEENQKVIRKAFNEVLKKEHEDEKIIPKLLSKVNVIGTIPVQGEPHKMFTFCTRTVYLGADFYSTNARTFIFSDSNIECLSVDISMDLGQIIGRQRLDCNLWRDSATLYVKTTKKKLTKSDFDKYLDKKIKKTNNLLEVYNIDVSSDEKRHDLAEKYKNEIIFSKYRYDYVAVNRQTESTLLPVFNNLMLISEQRAFEIQQIDYADRFSVFNTIRNEKFDKNIRKDILEIAENFNKIRNTTEKFKLLVEFGELDDVTNEDLKILFGLIPDKYREFYTFLGPEKIKHCKYKESLLRKEWIKIQENIKLKEGSVISSRIYDLFKVGEKYSKAYIKETLNTLYKELNYNRTAKANDLEEYFVIKKAYTADKKNGFKIVEKIT